MAALAACERAPQRGALSVLSQAHERHPTEREIVVALVEYSELAGDRKAATHWAKKLADLSSNGERG